MKIGKLWLGLTLLVGTVEARIWTNKDGSKSFEATFLSVDHKFVTVKKDGKEMQFRIDVLSDTDKEWLKPKIPIHPTREWTSAESGKQITATLVAKSKDSITLKIGTRTFDSKLASFSKEDQDWVANYGDEILTRLREAEEKRLKASLSKLAAMTVGKTYFLKDGELQKQNIQKDSDYYLVYYGRPS